MFAWEQCTLAKQQSDITSNFRFRIVSGLTIITWHRGLLMLEKVQTPAIGALTH